MSRSGYTDDGDDTWQFIMWRGAVASATKGRRGQELFKELIAGMDAMPEKKLISSALEENGCQCALGVVGKARGMDLTKIDPENSRQVADEFNIANALACEIVYMNDEAGPSTWTWTDTGLIPETPEARWVRIRQWAEAQINLEPCI